MNDNAPITELESAIEMATRQAFRTGFTTGQLAAVKFIGTIKCGTHVENLLLLTVMKGINELVSPVLGAKQ